MPLSSPPNQGGVSGVRTANRAPRDARREPGHPDRVLRLQRLRLSRRSDRSSVLPERRSGRLASGGARRVRHRPRGAAGRRRLLRMAGRPMGAPKGAGLLGAVHGSRQQHHRTAADLWSDRCGRRRAAPPHPAGAGHLHGRGVGRCLHLHLRVGTTAAEGLPGCRHTHRVQPRVHVRRCHGRRDLRARHQGSDGRLGLAAALPDGRAAHAVLPVGAAADRGHPGVRGGRTARRHPYGSDPGGPVHPPRGAAAVHRTVHGAGRRHLPRPDVHRHLSHQRPGVRLHAGPLAERGRRARHRAAHGPGRMAHAAGSAPVASCCSGCWDSS